MRYWIFIFLLSLASFGLSGVLYFAKTNTNDANDIANNTNAFTLLFVGDIMLSRSVGAVMRKENDFAHPFRLVADTLRKADIAFGNLEGPISVRGEKQGSIYSFRADPRVAEGLTLAGFDVLSLANNHSMDWGRDALQDTRTTLEDNDIKPVGAGMDERQANEPVFFCASETTGSPNLSRTS